MNRIYLDSNILIAYYSQDKPEETKKKMVDNALAVFAQLKDIQLCTSMWAVTEMVNILVSSKKMNRGIVAEIENQLVNERRLRNLKLHFLEISPDKEYDFGEFFYHVRHAILKYHSGVGDVIHSVNRTPVDSLSSLRAALDPIKTHDPVVLQIERDDGYQWLAFEME